MDQLGHKIPFPDIDLTLTGISIAGICTSMQVREAGLCVDCGLLTPLGVRMPYLALTHGHVDHAGAVATYLGNRKLMRMGKSTIFAPLVIVDQLREITRLWEEIQGRPYENEFVGVEAGEFYEMGSRLSLRPFTTHHTVPSVGYTLVRQKHVLREDLVGLDGREIAKLSAAGEEVNTLVREPLMTFTGDSTPEGLANDAFARSARVVVTELSFLGEKERTTVETARMGMHTHIDELLPVMEILECDHVVFMHLSRKYTVEEAEKILKERIPEKWSGRWSLLHHEDRRA